MQGIMEHLYPLFLRDAFCAFYVFNGAFSFYV
jgi:hypothetical protein